MCPEIYTITVPGHHPDCDAFRRDRTNRFARLYNFTPGEVSVSSLIWSIRRGFSETP